MATNPIQAADPTSYETRVQRAESPFKVSNTAHEISQQAQRVQEGTVTAPQKISRDCKKDAIDPRNRESREHREKKLDKKA